MDKGGKTLSKSTSGLRMIPTNEVSSSPFAMEEPAWIPDKQVTKCLGCERHFDFFNRRHHCRRCGRCFCSNCCSHILRLQRMYFIDPVRHCYDCAILSKAEEEFYDKGITILINGRQMSIEDKSWEGEAPKHLGMYLCRLTSDHRTIGFTASKPLPRDAMPPPTIQLNNVTELAIIENSKLSPGHGLKVYYKDDGNTSIVHCMQLNPVDERSIPWIEWAHKALQMTNESQNQTIHN